MHEGLNFIYKHCGWWDPGRDIIVTGVTDALEIPIYCPDEDNGYRCMCKVEVEEERLAGTEEESLLVHAVLFNLAIKPVDFLMRFFVRYAGLPPYKVVKIELPEPGKAKILSIHWTCKSDCIEDPPAIDWVFVNIDEEAERVVEDFLAKHGLRWPRCGEECKWIRKAFAKVGKDLGYDWELI